MRPLSFWISSFVLTTALAASASAADIDALEWMTGCWVGVTEGQHHEECWLHPAGGHHGGLVKDCLAGGDKLRVPENRTLQARARVLRKS